MVRSARSCSPQLVRSPVTPHAKTATLPMTTQAETGPQTTATPVTKATRATTATVTTTAGAMVEVATAPTKAMTACH